MTILDWAIMIIAVVSLRFISLSTRSHMRGVADFLAANRSAGRYLLTIAGQMGSTGSITLVAMFQMYFCAGLPPIWWAFMSWPSSSIVILTGWVYYRYRETQALTLAQFLEMRYGYRFRVFAGIICFVSGVFNFGIFPAVTARFFIYYCGLPDHFHLLGATIPSIAPVMFVDLGLALTFVTMGGQISVMVTECAQGMVSAFAFIIITAAVLIKLHWPDMVHALNMSPANASMLHPYHTGGVKNYNMWYFIVGVLGAFYGQCSWQGSAAFFTSGRSAHEQKMGGIISVWRQLPLVAMYTIIPIAAYAITKLPEYSAIALKANHTLSLISNPDIRSQMQTPVIMVNFLPVGIKGLLATVMLFFSFTCHDTYMHSWGSIFIQDVVLPIRKRAIDPVRHVQWLRWSIIGVAIFAFLFSLFYDPKEDILMYFAITGTIWLGGSGAVIVGGLYWKKGCTSAAYCSLALGTIVGVGGIIISHWYKIRYGHDFPLNEQWLFALTMLCASLIYVIVSLLTHKKWINRVGLTVGITAAVVAFISLAGMGVIAQQFPHLFGLVMHSDPIIKNTVLSIIVLIIYTIVCMVTCWKTDHEFNLEKMLHRGQYRNKKAEELGSVANVTPLQKLLGITDEFSFGDKCLAVSILVWNLGWASCFFVVSILNGIYNATGHANPFTGGWWAGFWHLYLMLTFFLGIPVTVWITIGGVMDIKSLFHTLSTAVRDHTDDGRVTHEADVVKQPVAEKAK